MVETVHRWTKAAGALLPLLALLVLAVASEAVARGGAPEVRVLLSQEAAGGKRSETALFAAMPEVAHVAPALRRAPKREAPRLNRWRTLTLKPGVDPERVVARLRIRPGVERAELPPVRTLQGSGRRAPAGRPGDPFEPFLWHLEQVSAFAAWDLVGDASSVILAVVDNGVDLDHPDLEPALWVNGAEEGGSPGADDDGNGFVDDIHGWDSYGWDGDPNAPSNTPNASHGTHCAGIAAAVGDNGRGVAGIAPGVRLMAVRAGVGTSIYAAEDGIIYAVDNGARVLSLSFSGGQYSLLERDAIAYALRQGAVVFAAAGNEGGTAPRYPAAYDEVIAVGAADHQDRQATFSNDGWWVEVAAPGVDILSTVVDGGYGYSTGTSMATPLAAGAAALLLAADPALDAAAVRARLNMGAVALRGVSGYDVPAGRLDAYRSLLSQRPVVTFREAEVSDQDGDGVLERGEAGELVLRFDLGGAPVGELQMTAAAAGDGLILDGSQVWQAPQAGALSSNPMSLYADTNTWRGEHGIIVTLRADDWRDTLAVSLPVDRGWATHEAGGLIATVSDQGAVGFLAGGGLVGVPEGVRLESQPRGLLYHGTVMVSDGSAVSAAVAGATQFEFQPLSAGHLRPVPGTGDQQVLTAQYQDAGSSTGAGVFVTQTTTSYPEEGPKAVWVELQVQPMVGAGDYEVGLYCDWDIWPAALNTVQYDPALRLSWIAGDAGAAGVISLDGTLSGVAAVNNPDVVYDGFSDGERAALMAQGTGEATGAAPDDWSHVVAVRLEDLDANTAGTARFALVAGETEQELLAVAQQVWDLEGGSSEPAAPGGEKAPMLLSAPRPNPFNSRVELTVTLSPTAERLPRGAVYDMLGRRVAGLEPAPRGPGRYALRWDGRSAGGNAVASGMYVVRVEGPAGVQQQRVTLLR